MSFAIAAWLGIMLILGVIQLLARLTNMVNYNEIAAVISGIEVNITGIIVIASVIKLVGVANSNSGMQASFLIVCVAVVAYSLLYWYNFNKNQKLKHSISEMNSSKKDKCEISNIIDKHIEIKLFGKHLYEKI